MRRDSATLEAATLEELTAMMTMPASGIITTKEDVQAFADSCVSLRSQWEHFQILFRGTDLKWELLQTTAPTFFGDLNRLFIEHLVLHICRLTDNAQTAGRKNLTVKFLIEHSDFSAAPGILDKLQQISMYVWALGQIGARDELCRVRDLIIGLQGVISSRRRMIADAVAVSVRVNSADDEDATLIDRVELAAAD
jgi:hypothetical protein